jgi:hypothetical protein
VLLARMDVVTLASLSKDFNARLAALGMNRTEINHA